MSSLKRAQTAGGHMGLHSMTSDRVLTDGANPLARAASNKTLAPAPAAEEPAPLKMKRKKSSGKLKGFLAKAGNGDEPPSPKKEGSKKGWGSRMGFGRKK